LRPQLFKGEWTPEEDQEIWDRVQEMGTKWAQISEQYMPSRTDNDIKNRWNSIIRKAHAPGGREWEAAENEMQCTHFDQCLNDAPLYWPTLLGDEMAPAFGPIGPRVRHLVRTLKMTFNQWVCL